jgi:hypothetical protein
MEETLEIIPQEEKMQTEEEKQKEEQLKEKIESIKQLLQQLLPIVKNSLSEEHYDEEYLKSLPLTKLFQILILKIETQQTNLKKCLQNYIDKREKQLNFWASLDHKTLTPEKLKEIKLNCQEIIKNKKIEQYNEFVIRQIINSNQTLLNNLTSDEVLKTLEIYQHKIENSENPEK